MACGTRRRFWCAAALLAALAATSPRAAAVEPRGMLILGLQLGMPAMEVLARLRAQGARDISPVPLGCDPMGDSSCPSGVTARTLDGTLTVRFGPAGNKEVIRIEYLLDGKRPNEQQVIREAVRDRFGPPSVSTPVRWCSAAAARRLCPDDSPHLELIDGPATAMRLVLTAGGDAPRGRSSALPARQPEAKKAGQQHQ